jgi:hypothetical protein
VSHSSTVDTRPLVERRQRLTETYKNGWDRVQEYETAMGWHATNPQQGSYAASRALELPRGRLRGWFDGGKPDAVRAIETAESHGWLDAVPGEPVFEGLSVLHAWVLAGGSISRDAFVPSFAVGPSDPVALAREALAAVGIPSQSVNGSSTKRAREIRPKGRGGSHLGRFLYGVLGAPIGGKIRIGAAPLQYLDSVPQMTLLRWCQTYITLRGTSMDAAGDGYTVRLGEKRSPAYREALAALFREVVGEDAYVTATRRATFLGVDAVTMLDEVPTLPDPR